MWKCVHCSTEVQFATANSQNKTAHLRKHGITQHGRKEPRQWIQNIAESSPPPEADPLRRTGSYVELTHAVQRNPFQEALIAFIVVCQMAMSLVADEIFLTFLRVLYPSIHKLMPGCGNTMRVLIIDAFKVRKAKLKETLKRAPSKTSFSFDLWTSPNHLALLGIVVHFINEFGQNQSVRGFSVLKSLLDLKLMFYYRYF